MRSSRSRRRRALGLGLGLLFVAQLAPAEAPVFSPSRLEPAGLEGRRRLLTDDDTSKVAAEVVDKGYYAGEALGAGDCSSCHAEIAEQWAASAHRFASFNNPYYAASVELFRKQRSPRASRFCAGCHDPLLLIDDQISVPNLSRQTPAAQAGLSCLVCHSVSAHHGTLGNGSYHLVAAPVPASGLAPVAPDRRPPHTERLRPSLLAQPEFCASCHKVGLGPEITHDVWLRGQNDYDGWLNSMAAGNGVGAVYRPESVEVRRCQDCHMPLEKLRSGQLVRSHRFLAANAALPHLRGDEAHEQRTAAFLKDAVSLDLAILPRAAQSGVAEPLFTNTVTVAKKQPILVDVVLRNRRVGHRFPSGTNDSNEIYIEVSAKPVGGGRGLSDATHLVRAQPVDAAGEPLRQRDPQNMRGVVYDTSLSPSDPQVVRYQLDLSLLPELKPGATVELSAALRYRKFSRDYTRFACDALPKTIDAATRERCLNPPVLEIARAERRLLLSHSDAALAEPARAGAITEIADRPLWQRYLDHGLGLADGLVEQAGAARPSLLAAVRMKKERPEPYLGLAKLALALGQTDEAVEEARRAEALRPDHPAAPWLRGLALYRAYRFEGARAAFERAAELLPRDKNLLVYLAKARGLTGDPQLTLQAAERLLALDSESEDGHHQRLLALRELGKNREADAAEQRYLFHRRPVERDQELRQLFRSRYPERIDEDTPAHTHALRPTPR